MKLSSETKFSRARTDRGNASYFVQLTTRTGNLDAVGAQSGESDDTYHIAALTTLPWFLQDNELL